MLFMNWKCLKTIQLFWIEKCNKLKFVHGFDEIDPLHDETVLLMGTLTLLSCLTP